VYPGLHRRHCGRSHVMAAGAVILVIRCGGLRPDAHAPCPASVCLAGSTAYVRGDRLDRTKHQYRVCGLLVHREGDLCRPYAACGLFRTTPIMNISWMPNYRPALDAAVAFSLHTGLTGAAPVRPGVAPPPLAWRRSVSRVRIRHFYP